MQTLRLSVPLLYGALVITVFRPWYLAHTALADGIFLVLGGACGTFLGGDADSCGAGDDLVKNGLARLPTLTFRQLCQKV